MDPDELREADFLLWTEQQAMAIRVLPRGPNQFDLDNLAEEIESLGRSELLGVESHPFQCLLHSLRIVTDPAPEAVDHRRSKALAFRVSFVAERSAGRRLRLGRGHRSCRGFDGGPPNGVTDHQPVVPALAKVHLTAMFVLKLCLSLFVLLYLLPLAISAVLYWRDGTGAGWRTADRSSVGNLPAQPGAAAVVRIFAAQTVRWRGVFAVHCWIVFKPEGAARYTRYDYTAWGDPVTPGCVRAGWTVVRA